MRPFPWTHLLLLSAVPTPCFVVDLKQSSTAPTIFVNDSLRLEPVQLDNDISVDLKTTLEAKICLLLHTQVVEASQDDVDGSLALVDLPNFVQDAELVLGLNNHLTISYYWARSAGAGATMEAPGIEYRDSRLFASKPSTNDGKRSEWVHFLRQGDQVQLRTDDWELLERIPDVYGVSLHDQPLGSEPRVICHYRLRKQ